MAVDLATRLREIRDRYDELTEELSKPEVVSDHAQLQRVAREQAGLADQAQLAKEWFDLERGLAGARGLLAESEGDREMEALAREEIAALESRREVLQLHLIDELQDRDPNDE